MEVTFTRAQLVELQAENMDEYLRFVEKVAKTEVLKGLREFAKKNPTAYKYSFPISGGPSRRQFLSDLTTEVSLLLPDFRVAGRIPDSLFDPTGVTGYIIIDWSTPPSTEGFLKATT